LVSVNATTAAIYRSLSDEHPPTLVIDEADTIFGSKRVAEQNEDLRALLNAGHQRGRPALRCVGPQQIPTEFPTFAMAAIAGIGAMPDTITDRAVNVTMRRRTRAEKVAQFRSRRDGPVLTRVRDRVARWAADHLAALTTAEPVMPVEDRAADTWEPLIAVADAAGGHWPDTARAACRRLVAAADEAEEGRSLSVKLLADVRDIFTTRGVAFISTADVVEALRGVEESPWKDFDLNARRLAKRLGEYGIRSARDGAGKVRGYRLEDLTDAFTRYLPSEASETSETGSEQQKGSDGTESSDAYLRQTVTIRQTETADQDGFLTGLTLDDGYRTGNGVGPEPELCCVCGFPAPPGRAMHFDCERKHSCPALRM